MEEVCGPEADTGIAISKGRHKPSPDISMTAAEGKEKGIEGTSGGEDQGDGSANGSSAGQAEQAPTTEMMQLDVKGDVGNESIGGDKVSDQGDLRQVEMSDTPVDPALQNQGVPEPPKENGVAEPTPDSTLDISSAASLISLAGGAFQYLSAQNASAQHVGTNGTAWPSSPESPNKTFNGHSQLPSMMGQNSSPSSRDGKHTTLPSLGSIEVLADLATKQGDSPQQVQSPGLPLPPTPASSEGTPRPSMQYQTVEQRRTFIPNEQQHAPFGYYAPIKDTSASPQPPYTTPDSANLFAARGGFSPATTDGRRPSTSSEFQYNSDHTATTPRGPSTCDTMASSSTEDGLVAQPPPPAPAPRSRGHSSALPPGGFKCEFEGCKAPPFQTQYLLNSHANVHSSVRPHYCPVKGCPRGEGGKGFKRKNEMIRHGLVHSSPGYICPFCPDREHKYPRPDNLQRHVRVHHMDKDKDDPQLREVLSQRPEGVNRGRRRRMASTS